MCGAFRCPDSRPFASSVSGHFRPGNGSLRRCFRSGYGRLRVLSLRPGHAEPAVLLPWKRRPAHLDARPTRRRRGPGATPARVHARVGRRRSATASCPGSTRRARSRRPRRRAGSARRRRGSRVPSGGAHPTPGLHVSDPGATIDPPSRSPATRSPVTRCQSCRLEALTSRGTLRHSRARSPGLVTLYVRPTSFHGVTAAVPAPESSPMRSNPAGTCETLATMATGIDHQIPYRFAVGSAGFLPLRGLPPAAPPAPRPRGRLGSARAANSGLLAPSRRSPTGSLPADEPPGGPALSPARTPPPSPGPLGCSGALPARPLRRAPLPVPRGRHRADQGRVIASFLGRVHVRSRPARACTS